MKRVRMKELVPGAWVDADALAAEIKADLDTLTPAQRAKIAEVRRAVFPSRRESRGKGKGE